MPVSEGIWKNQLIICFFSSADSRRRHNLPTKVQLTHVTLRRFEFQEKKILQRQNKKSEYLFGIEEDEGLSIENVPASWNYIKVDIF